MYARADHDSILLFDLFWGIIEISNRQHIARISRESLAKQLSLKEVVGARVSFDSGYISHEIKIFVRITVRKIDSVVIVIVLEGNIECQGIIMESPPFRLIKFA